MKKLLLALLAVVTATAAASAMNLKDAYKALSNIPNVKEVAVDYNLRVNGMSDSASVAAGYNLNAEQIRTTGNAAFALLNQVPLSYMINGASNGEVAAFVYAEPNNSGNYDMLIVAMSGSLGNVAFVCDEADAETVTALQNGKLSMEGSYLELNAKLSDDNEFNIYLSKAR